MGYLNDFLKLSIKMRNAISGIGFSLLALVLLLPKLTAQYLNMAISEGVIIPGLDMPLTWGILIGIVAVAFAIDLLQN